MKKIWIVTSIIVITSVFIYSMIYLSSINSCTWVRVFECKSQENKDLVSDTKFYELKPTWDLFLKYCEPKIKEGEKFYSLDYSDCNLNINISKESNWVENINVNWLDLTREEINSNF